MDALNFSFVIPVFNRPDEIDELLKSIVNLKSKLECEVIIVEDGSTIPCLTVVESYRSQLNVSYYSKPNSGPGDSRNYGMSVANGNYFIILDSDCLLPETYLEIVTKNLTEDYVDCYGGPDAAHDSFSDLQKAINFAMTSFISTGGIRGGKKGAKHFQPRSFNMGLSKEAFKASGGFGTIHPGEDPDLAIRLKNLGFRTALFEDAFVYHKRRISWKKFYQQIYKFGMVRPILNTWHPETNKPVFWLPTIFCVGFAIAIVSLALNFKLFAILYGCYFLVAFLLALSTTKNGTIAVLSLLAILIQFFAYGYGFLKSTLILQLSNTSPEHLFPNLFFKHVK